MTLPNFLIIGAQKAGTSWLGSMLAQHPEIFIAKKEIHFFDRLQNFNKGISWYEEKFEKANKEKAIGEKTPEYLWINKNCSNVHKDIYKYLPEAKLIIVLRNPVERAISHVNHLVRYGRVPFTININNFIWKDFIIEKGKYCQQIKTYYEIFSREQILIIFNEEELLKKPQITLKKACEFLGVNSSFSFSNATKKIHQNRVTKAELIAGAYFPPLRPFIKVVGKYLPIDSYKLYPNQDTITQMYHYYAEENEELFKLLNYRPVSWSL